MQVKVTIMAIKKSKDEPADSKLTDGKPESKAIAKTFTEAEARDFVRERLRIEADPAYFLSNAAKFLEEHEKASKKDAKKEQDEFLKIASKALMALGLETHYVLAETTSERYWPLAIEIARQIEREYDCKTPTEKMLAETAASAYIRMFTYSRKLNALTDERHLSAERNGYGGMLSKEIDRAQRHLLSTLLTLRQIKNPPLELNIRATTAFVAQNQQINAKNNPAKQNENQ